MNDARNASSGAIIEDVHEGGVPNWPLGKRALALPWRLGKHILQRLSASNEENATPHRGYLKCNHAGDNYEDRFPGAGNKSMGGASRPI